MHTHRLLRGPRDRRRWAITLATALVLVTGCSGSTTNNPASSTTSTEAAASSTAAATATTTTTAPPETPTTTLDLSAHTVSEVAAAVGRITTEGAFFDRPDSTDIAGTGIATLIDPTGLAITTARAVVGATSIAVTLNDRDTALPATLVAYDECANLALIEIEGDDFVHLDIGRPPAPGTSVYSVSVSADRELAVREGILERAQADGFTSWVKVNSLLEHSAGFPLGTSGTPLVDANGALVGISHIPSEDGHHLAIPPRDIRALINGRETRGLGINAISVTGPFESGEFISAIDPSSVIATMGIEPGDVIVSIGDSPMAPSGARGAYCRVVDTAESEQLPIDVFTERIPSRWVGTIERDSLLERDFDLERALAYMLPTKAGLPAYDMTLHSSDYSEMEMRIPAAWTDRRGGNWVDKDTGDEFGRMLAAAVDYDAWRDSWDVPGVFMGRSAFYAQAHTPESYLDANPFSICTHVHRSPLTAGAMDGFYDLLFDCDVAGSAFAQAALQTQAGDELIILQVALVDERDIPALLTIFESFDVFNEG